MSGRRGPVAALLLALGAALALWLVSGDDSDARRVALTAIDSEEAAALCAQSGAKLADFWARAKAIGVGAAIVRPQPLGDAVRRGEILRFERAELERWKAVGLLPPSATLRPDTFWTKDARLYELLLQAISEQGVSPTTGTAAGFRYIEVPEGRDVRLRGYDPQRVAALGGLTPVYAEDAGPIERVGLRWRADGLVGQADPAPEERFDMTLEAAAWRVGGSPAMLLRRALARPRRLLLLRLDPRLDLEGNLAGVRGAVRELAARGALASPGKPEDQQAAAPWKRTLALAVAWLLGLLGPLLAARGGLLVLRRLRELALERRPVLSPVLQLAGGLAATAAFAAASAAVVHALSSSAAPLSPRWAFAAMAGPLAIAALTLYAIDLEAWGRALRRPATYAALLALAAAVLAAALLLAPRWTLERLGLGAARRWAPSAAALWWWPWRWRETLVGFPCLLQAMFLVNWRLDCPDCASLPARPLNDPRGWFMLGLLAPIGIVQAVGGGAFPEALAALHTLATLAIGAVLGSALIAWRLRGAHAHETQSRSKGPA